MSYFQFSKDDIMRGAELTVMMLLGLIVMFTVVRPLVRRIITPEGVDPQMAAAARTAALAGAIGAANPATVSLQGDSITVNAPPDGSITTTGGPNVSIVGGDEQVAISNRTSTMIDIAKVQGQVHAQSVQKVGELAQNNPHEAVSIIRSWLHEDAA
jgi:flagellar M-ring protein FliF